MCTCKLHKMYETTILVSLNEIPFVITLWKGEELQFDIKRNVQNVSMIYSSDFILYILDFGLSRNICLVIVFLTLIDTVITVNRCLLVCLWYWPVYFFFLLQLILVTAPFVPFFFFCETMCIWFWYINSLLEFAYCKFSY